MYIKEPLSPLENRQSILTVLVDHIHLHSSIIPMRQKSKKGLKTKKGTVENPVILKMDKKRDTSKQCDYCKTQGWKGIGHIE
jgi:hypothetical protein